jgi:hypothetical protein
MSWDISNLSEFQWPLMNTIQIETKTLKCKKNMVLCIVIKIKKQMEQIMEIRQNKQREIKSTE